tara:strand:- start:1680 stop:2846 length:1167 start_codon:yes stop_codon:yes gene_type:complete
MVLILSLVGIILGGNLVPKKSKGHGKPSHSGKSGSTGNTGTVGPYHPYQPSSSTYPSPQGPSGPEVSKYLKAYVEDCTQANSIAYNLEQLGKLDIIGLDFSLNCYESVNSTLSKLKGIDYRGKVFIHFDQTAQSDTCGALPPAAELKKNGMTEVQGEDIMNNCYDTLKKNVDSSNMDIIKGILWEQEGNKFINACASVEWCQSFWKTKGLEFAGWLTKFDFFVPLDQNLNWDYAFYEYYNIYSKCKKLTPLSSCQVDYNPTADKCFPGAQSSPDKTPTKCGEGKVYCENISPEDRGSWMATVLINSKNNSFPMEDRDISKKVIYFTFTTGSNPSFYQTITTAKQFDKFVEGFFSTFTKAGVKNIQKYKIGVWGCPQWMGKGTSTISFC